MYFDTFTREDSHSIIKTGFYSSNMRHFLYWFILDLRGQGKQDFYNGTVMSLKTAPDREILIDINKDDSNYWRTCFARSSAEEKSLIASKIKNIACERIKKHWHDYTATHNEKLGKEQALKALWTRDNDEVVISKSFLLDFDVTVADIYFIYESFKGCKNLDRKYSRKLIEKWCS